MSSRDNRFADMTASRRDVLRALASAVSTSALGGCTSTLLSAGARFDAAELYVNPTLLVATTRKPASGAHAAPWFGTERGKLVLARARLKPPKDGRFSLAAIGLDDWRLESIETVSQVGDLLVPAVGTRDVLFYVHGYNQTFETAALDAAHLSDGIRFRGETMVFSWPSRAKLLDYVYDRESAMWSRDSLEQVLSGLITSPNVGRIHIVAHSEGTVVTFLGLLNGLRQPEEFPWVKHVRGLMTIGSPLNKHIILWPELWAGLPRHEASFPVQYLGANVPQAWAAGSVLQMVRILLGLEPDMPAGRIYLDPALPAWCSKLELRRLRLGRHEVRVSVERKGDGRHVVDADAPGLEVVHGVPPWLEI